jgi:hypothetical protein
MDVPGPMRREASFQIIGRADVDVAVSQLQEIGVPHEDRVSPCAASQRRVGATIGEVSQTPKNWRNCNRDVTSLDFANASKRITDRGPKNSNLGAK